jgi:solute carrier family 25 (mitochondrial thiamine pyrophosphate transporter), member 19
MMAVQFHVYEKCKTAMARYNTITASAVHSPSSPSSSLSPFQQSAAGFTAGVVSKLATMPLDVIKKRCQVQQFAHYDQHLTAATAAGQDHKRGRMGMLQTGWSICRREGISGLYRGSVPSLIKAGPNAAIIYLVYEQVMQQISKRRGCEL